MKNDGYFTAVKHFLEQNPDVTFRENHLNLSEFDVASRQYVATNLIRFRKQLGFSQSKFSRLAGCSLSQYKQYESGAEAVRLDIAHRITLTCGFPLFHLLRGSEYEKYIPIPEEHPGFDRIWFYANSLSDVYFRKLCEMLLLFSELGLDEIEIPESGLSNEDFEIALEENRGDIYRAIAQGLRAMRLHFGCSQPQVADLIDVSLGTYQSYEKDSPTPRFNIFVAARHGICTGIHPFAVLQGTHLFRIRKMQNLRVDAIQKIMQSIEKSILVNLPPLVEGFYQAVFELPKARFIEID